jgi:1-deoxy-D-xylulose-5-phosphate reductoisomerase
LKNISILGSTGSIGTQALSVIEANPELYRVCAITGQSNTGLLISQALKFKPDMVVICDAELYQEVKSTLAHTEIRVLAGVDALCEAASMPDADLVLTAIVGSVGLKPTIAAIKAGKDIGLANKETLVVAGDLVTRLAKEHGVKIIPVDSEHSAIFQCLVGEELTTIEKIYLTASGGPFRGSLGQLLRMKL